MKIDYQGLTHFRNKRFNQNFIETAEAGMEIK